MLLYSPDKNISMFGEYRVSVPEGKSGMWCIEHFTVLPKDELFQQINSTFRLGRFVPVGTYTRLKYQDTTVMSDTPDEITDHLQAIEQAQNQVLITGLGLGLAVQAMLNKPSVEKVTVLEVSLDVISLVAPHYRQKYGKRVEIIHADAFEWIPPRQVRYSVVWHDIWNHISEDNLKDMKVLKQRYQRGADWQGCWTEKEGRLAQRL